MSKTPRSHRFQYIYYMTKNLRLDLHDRLRVQAALRHTTIEDIINTVLEVGLPAVERQTADEKKARRRAEATI
jgi:plasmid stability protein